MLLQLISNKCPNCQQGHVFQSSNLFTYKKDFMNKECPVCHRQFEKEPGFFMGAMYVSYALGILESFTTYFGLQQIGANLPEWVFLFLPIVPLLLFAPFNFRMARLVWLYIFP